MALRLSLLLVIAAGLTSVSFGATVAIDFEGLPDGTSAVGLFAPQGVAFSSGIIVTSGAFGGSLNELDFPPLVPGQAVFLNDADVTTLSFTTPITSFAGYFTYGGPLSLQFFGPGNTLLTTLTTSFLTNIGSGGDPGSSPNELISVMSLNAVRLDILATNTDFTLDGLSYTAADTAPVPEPAAGLLVLCPLAIGLLARHRPGRKSAHVA